MVGREAFAAAQAVNLEQIGIEAQQTVREIEVHGAIAHCWTELSIVIIWLETGAVGRP